MNCRFTTTEQIINVRFPLIEIGDEWFIVTHVERAVLELMVFGRTSETNPTIPAFFVANKILIKRKHGPWKKGEHFDEFFDQLTGFLFSTPILINGDSCGIVDAS